ncbi:MAG TPA: hypothetical protein PKU97_23490, partial [Kofleriaceae bacterium]|nr:hypothetical protein [Kofleriaceae bacterium]
MAGAIGADEAAGRQVPGLPRSGRLRPASLAARKPEALLEAIRGKLDSDDAFGRAQVAAIVRHDVIVDLSPWRAFERWASVGFRDAEQALATGFSATAPDTLAVFGFAAEGLPAEVSTLLSTATVPAAASAALAAATAA